MANPSRLLSNKPAAAIAAASLVLCGALGGLIAAGTTAGASGSGTASGATIQVTGKGVVTGMPDTLTLQLGVSTKGVTAAGALNQNNNEMTTLQQVFTAAGIAPKDLQTSNLNVSPNYDSNGNITSYGAEDDLTVTLHDLAHAGSIIDDAANVVGNDVQIQSLSFSISNTSALLRAARIQAMQNAQSEASDIASGAGTTLGSIVRVVDQENDVSPPVVFGGFAAANTAKDAAGSVPLQGGSQQLSVQVAVTYQLTS